MDTIFEKYQEVISRKVAGEVILVPISGEVANMQHIFSLNPLAELIWSRLDGESTVAEIVRTIVSEYEVEYDEAEKDCLAFIDSLVAKKLIRERN